MNEGFLCVGGPLDGQMQACMPRCASFEVWVLSQPIEWAFYGSLPKNMTYARQVYHLEYGAADGGLAWVFKE